MFRRHQVTLSIAFAIFMAVVVPASASPPVERSERAASGCAEKLGGTDRGNGSSKAGGTEKGNGGTKSGGNEGGHGVVKGHLASAQGVKSSGDKGNDAPALAD